MPFPYTHAGTTRTLFTWTSAMACWSWSLPAGKAYSCPAEHRGPNSICDSCYAQQGNYLFSNVRESQMARFDFFRSSPTVCDDLIVHHINDAELPFFRVHDSGDFHNIDAVHRWTDIVRRCPATRFWFPTRTHLFPYWLPALRALHRLPNAVVRPSALNFGDEPPVVPGLGHGTVSMDQSLPGIHTCPKSLLGGDCETHSCRTCWDDTTYVNYLRHGHVITDAERRVRLTIGATNATT
jgi:hypothetical protein